MRNEPFSYATLVQYLESRTVDSAAKMPHKLTFIERNWFKNQPDKTIITFSREFIEMEHPASQNQERHINHAHGWKFHISIDDTIQETDKAGYSTNLEKAWNIVKDILIEYRIHSAKVVKPGKYFSTDETKQQYGKQITIYPVTDQRTEKNIAFWNIILSKIEFGLEQAGVRSDPNQNLSRDLPVFRATEKKSHYITYRNTIGIPSDTIGYIYFLKYLCSKTHQEFENSFFGRSALDITKFIQDYFSNEDGWNLPFDDIPKLLARDKRFDEKTMSQLFEVEIIPEQDETLTDLTQKIIETNLRYTQRIEEINVASNPLEIARKNIHFDPELLELQNRLNQLREEKWEYIQKTFSLNFSIDQFCSNLEEYLKKRGENHFLFSSLAKFCSDFAPEYSKYGINDNNYPDPFKNQLRLEAPKEPYLLLETVWALCSANCCSCCIVKPEDLLMSSNVILDEYRTENQLIVASFSPPNAEEKIQRAEYKLTQNHTANEFRGSAKIAQLRSGSQELLNPTHGIISNLQLSANADNKLTRNQAENTINEAHEIEEATHRTQKLF